MAIEDTKAQSQCEGIALPQETVVVHLDRNIYLAGETIWFKAWCFLNGQLDQEMSKVLYIEIFDETENTIVQQKFRLNDNTSFGSISIPADVSSKYYYLRAYTKYMRNFSPELYHYQQIIVVNPLIENGSIHSSLSDLKKPSIINDESGPETNVDIVNLINVKLERSKYAPRQELKLNISKKDELIADLSMTVRIKGLGNKVDSEGLDNNDWLIGSCLEDPYCRLHSKANEATKSGLSANNKRNPLTAEINDLEWLPETRGLTLSGVIQNKNSEQVRDALATVAVLQNDPMIYFGLSDEKGDFTISLHDMIGQQELFVGMSNDANKVLIKNDFESEYPSINATPLQYDSSLHKHLEFLYLNFQLQEVYNQVNTRSVYEIDSLNVPNTNILEPDRRILIGDFINVTTMEEVFEEIANGVLVKTVNGKKRLRVYNSINQNWSDSTLILLDNIPVYDIEELLKLDPVKIEAVEFFHSEYILGDYTIESMVSIKTNTDNFGGYKWGEHVAFTTFKSFTSSQIFEDTYDFHNLNYPDFRPVLYWDPDLNLNQESKEKMISIMTPDRPGVYEIVVQGFTKSGIPFFGHTTFEVDQGKN